ncbi:MAG TPA: SCO family protein [Usitatibacter sp.]|nr:SCO family protein [Usitatibacter sp.]
MRAAAAAALCGLLVTVCGCDKLLGPGKPLFHGTDVTGMEAGQSLRLDDTAGKPRTLADFRGEVVAVTFGYTECPDVCPTTLHDWAQAMKRLGADASRVQFLFVTVDPARDTPERLGEYVKAFDPRFVGLRGDEKAIDAVKQDFHVYSEERPGKTPDSYTVDHSSQVFVFDPAGRLRLVEPAGTSPGDIASDLRALLAS